MPVFALFVDLNGGDPHLSLHAAAADALQALRKFAIDELGCYDLPADEQLPEDPSKLIEYLIAFCDVVDVRLWRCELGAPGESVEFEPLSQAAA